MEITILKNHCDEFLEELKRLCNNYCYNYNYTKEENNENVIINIKFIATNSSHVIADQIYILTYSISEYVKKLNNI